jgi:rhodanese-related sulfurtransferase
MTSASQTGRQAAHQSIADVLAAARERIRRLTPEQAQTALQEGALLVDTRPQWQRDRDGAFPDDENVLVIERNHLEWRLDPASDARIAEAVDHDVEVIVACSEGYASSLAAASLVDLGLHRAADLDGGFLAWRDAGLPTRDPNS